MCKKRCRDKWRYGRMSRQVEHKLENGEKGENKDKNQSREAAV